MDADEPLQVALFARLDGAVFGKTGAPSFAIPVFDHVPEDGVKPPYIVIGDVESDPWDAKDSNGGDCVAEIDVYSTHRGRKEAKRIAGSIYGLLHHQPLTVEGFQVILIRFEHANYTTEADGLTRRGTLRYHVLLSHT